MVVFENESDASQDANYREHLNRNWDNGNITFDNLFGKYNGLLDEYDAVNSRLDDAEQKNRDLQGDVKALSQRCDKIEEKHSDDIKKVQEQLDRINQAVFGYGEFEINYQNPPKQRPDDYEVNYRKPLNTGQPTHELNNSEIGGKHNFIEIETERDHKKEKGL